MKPPSIHVCFFQQQLVMKVADDRMNIHYLTQERRREQIFIVNRIYRQYHGYQIES